MNIRALTYDFSKPDENSLIVLKKGFSHRENWGVWTDSTYGCESEMVINWPKMLGDKVSEFKESVFASFHFDTFVPKSETYLGVDIFLNGRKIDQKAITHSNKMDCFDIRFNNIEESSSLIFKLSGTSSPAQHKISADARKLGLGFKKATFENYASFQAIKNDYIRRSRELHGINAINDPHGFFRVKPCINITKQDLCMQIVQNILEQNRDDIAKRIHDSYIQSIKTWNSATQLSHKQQRALPLKIPTLTHTIWITSFEKPNEMPDWKILLTIEGYKKLKEDPYEKWVHYIWVMDTSKIPRSVKTFENSGLNIVFKEQKDIDELFDGFCNLKSMFYKNFHENRFVQALDSFKALTIYKHGGIVTDLGKIRNSPWLLFRLYDEVFELTNWGRNENGTGYFIDVPSMCGKKFSPSISTFVSLLNSFEDLPKEKRIIHPKRSRSIQVAEGLTPSIYTAMTGHTALITQGPLYEISTMGSYIHGTFGQKSLQDNFLIYHTQPLIDESDIEDSGLFDPSYYLAHVNTKGMNPLEHFCKIGWKEGHNPNSQFEMKNALKDSKNHKNPFAEYVRTKMVV